MTSKIVDFLIDGASGLSYRDRMVVASLHRTLCVALDLARPSNKSVVVVEVGSGFSTLLLSRFAEKGLISNIATIDADAQSLSKNSRTLSSHSLFEDPIENKHEFHNFVTASIEDVNKSYALETLLNYGVKNPFASLPRFMSLSTDSRNYLPLSPYITEIGNIRFSNEFSNLLDTPIYKYFAERNVEEVEMLKLAPKNSADEFRNLLQAKRPNVLILDGGELSSLSDFLNSFTMLQVGDMLILHDIVFPKSVKNWLPVLILSHLDDWEILEIDFSTAQGICLAIKTQ